ncbi:MAG TPA: cupredoxin domain-containing protein [Mycobacteriales bacterium]|nr:cupredoxin domain-containing protein [Mycobacteriales bacterium]
MRTLPLALAALLATGLTACSDSGDGTASATTAPTSASPTPAGTTGATVHDLRALRGNRWSVATLTIAAGDTVKVTDADSDVPHNFVVPGVGRSKTLNDGDVFTLRFPTAGTFSFECTFHDGMDGTITVR